MDDAAHIRQLKGELAAAHEVISRLRSALDKCAGVALVLYRAGAMIEGTAQDLTTAVTGIAPNGEPLP